MSVERRERINRIMVVILALLITIFFFYMIRGFLMAIFFSAVFAGLLRPVHNWFLGRTGKRTSLASVLTILFVIFAILTPLGLFFGVLVEEAISLGNNFKPWLKDHFSDFDDIAAYLEGFPIIHQFFPNQELLADRLQEIAENLSGVLISELSHWTSGTLNFVVMNFIMLYTLFFFLSGGQGILKQALFLIPIKPEIKERLLFNFQTVTKATMKGTLIIGIVQGALGGVAIWVAGIPHALLWGSLMALLSIVPALGTTIVWLPAGIVLILGGKVIAGVALLAFCGIVVGNIDNVLRPILVGKDANLPELYIFFGTLGGLAMFGIAGIVIGPLVAAMFFSIWKVYYHEYWTLLREIGLHHHKDHHMAAPPPQPLKGDPVKKKN